MHELQKVEGSAFLDDWQNLTTTGRSDWSYVPLLNKGVLDDEGCVHAPKTCGVLRHLVHKGHLAPRHNATEVGARLLRLAPGGKLRAHHGPGGRLVAHLGVRVPAGGGATLTVAGETRGWQEGELLVFDDAFIHHAQNEAPTDRIILHVTFPKEQQPRARASAAVATIAAPAFRVTVYANCTAQTTLAADGRVSNLQPLLTLYNRVADNNDRDLDPCVSAIAVGGDTVRVAAAHGYGTVDVRWEVHPAWVIFELADLSQWHADPAETHISMARLGWGMLPATWAPFTSGKFQGFRGMEGHEPWSAGFFTLASEWAQYNTFFYAKQGQRIAFTCVKTAALPATWAALGDAEGLPKPNPARAVTCPSRFCRTLFRIECAALHSYGPDPHSR